MSAEAISLISDEEFISPGAYTPENELILAYNSGAPDTFSPNSLEQYKIEIRRHPLLTADQEKLRAKEIELGRAARDIINSDRNVPNEETEYLINKYKSLENLPEDSEKEPITMEFLVKVGDKAQETLINSNLRLVMSNAKRYTRSGLPLLDLIQEGNLGLIKAVEKFDVNLGYKLSTYATYWIRQSMLLAIGNKAHTIRVPIGRMNDILSVLQHKTNLEEDLGRQPTMDELSENSKIPTAEIKNLLKDNDVQPLSLETPMGKDDLILADLVGDENNTPPDELALESVKVQEISRALGMLSAKEKVVLIQHFGLMGEQPRQIDEIGEELSLSRSRVGVIQRRALAKLRHPTMSAGLEE